MTQFTEAVYPRTNAVKIRICCGAFHLDNHAFRIINTFLLQQCTPLCASNKQQWKHDTVSTAALHWTQYDQLLHSWLLFRIHLYVKTIIYVKKYLEDELRWYQTENKNRKFILVSTLFFQYVNLIWIITLGPFIQSLSTRCKRSVWLI